MASERTVNGSTARITLSSTFPKMTILLMCLQLLIFSSVVRGEIQCECNTPDCKHNRVSTCVAKYYCFTEYIYDQRTRHYRPKVRGCIDRRTPISCERFVPQDPSGKQAFAWPVSYCCDDSWCNMKKHMRRLPDERNGDKNENPYENPRDEPRKTTNKAAKVDGEQQKDSSQKSKFNRAPRAPPLSPNPAHIAVPVAGAFFVISLIVLVVILVRRKDAEGNNSSLANKYQTVSVSFGSGMKPTIAKDNSYEAPPIPPPIPLYASVGSKPAYPLCPVVTRAPC